MSKFERPCYDARKDGADCDACPLRNKKPIFPTYRSNPKLLIIDKQPGQDDAIFGTQFKGDLGAWLRDRLEPIGLRLDDCDFTAEIMCAPGALFNNKKAMKLARKCCAKRLQSNVLQSKAPVIMAQGAGFKALTGKSTAIEHWSGWPIKLPELGKALIPSFGIGVTAFGSKEEGRAKETKKAGQTDTELFTLFLKRGKDVAEKTWDFEAFKWPDGVIWESDVRLPSVLASFDASAQIAVDLETNIYDDNCITAINISNGTHTLSLPWDSYSNKKWGTVESISDGLKQRLIRLITTKRTIWHNSFFDVPYLAKRGIIIDPKLCDDTILMHAAYRPGYRHSLDWATVAHLRIPRWKIQFQISGDKRDTKRYVEARQEDLRNYGCQDAFATYLLYNYLKKKFDADTTEYFNRAYKQYRDLSTIALKVYSRGFCFDVNAKQNLEVTLNAQREAPLQRLDKAAQFFEIDKFSVTKTKKLRELFKDKLGVSGLKLTDMGEESFDKSVIAKLLSWPDQRVQVLAGDVRTVKTIDKLLSTYVSTDMFDKDNRVRSTINVFGTITGRFSTSDPNIQQVPPIVRQCYVATPGMWLLKGDYDALELKISAYVSGAKRLLAWMEQGADMHIENAKMIFGSELNESNVKLLRSIAKTIAYGKIYGSGVKTMYANNVAKIPGLRIEQLEVAYRKFNELHPEILDYAKYQQLFALKHGYVESYITKRRRYFYGAKPVPTVTSNHPIQSTAADIANMAMIEIDKLLNWQTEFLLAQVHDELCIETNDPIRGYNQLKAAMEKPVILNGVERSMSITVKMGKSWNNCKEVSCISDIKALT